MKTFGAVLKNAMNKKGLGTKEVATKIGMSYEHIRKIEAGKAYPSRHLIRELAKLLSLSVENLENVLTADRIEHQYGAKAYAVLGLDPKMARWKRVVPLLTEDQADMLFIQGRAMLPSRPRSKPTRN